MNRSISLLIAFALAGCAPQESPPEDRAPTADATLVVPSPTVVPSTDGPVVVFLGTSITAGLGLDSVDESYVAHLEALADSSGKPFRAVNAGVSGETSAGGLRRLDWVLRQPLDVLVLELGANDGLRGQDPFALADNLTQIIRRTRTRYPDVRVILAGMEAPPNLGDLYASAFRRVFSGVAEAERAVLIPFLLEGVAGVPEFNQDDRIHPTAEGHMLIARHAWPVLEGVLDDLREARR